MPKEDDVSRNDAPHPRFDRANKKDENDDDLDDADADADADADDDDDDDDAFF